MPRPGERRRRVVVLTTWYPSPQQPGTAPFCRDHVQLIAQRCHVQVVHVRLGSSLPDENTRDDGVIVRRRSLQPRHPANVLALRRELRRLIEGADLVHTMAFSAALIQLLALPPVPWVHTEHWSGVRDPATVSGLWPRFAWLRRVLGLPDVVTGVTEELTGILARFAAPGASRQLPCVVSMPDRPASLPAGPGLPMVAVGWLNDGKDPITAVRAMALVRERGIDARLTWLGSGPLEAETAREAERLGVAEFLHLAGAVPHEDVGRWLARARLFFLPTRFENFCVAAAEALGAGRPLVIGGHGGHLEYLTPANARAVARQEPPAYADAIEQMWQELQAGAIDPTELAVPIRDRYGNQAVLADIEETYRLAERRCAVRGSIGRRLVAAATRTTRPGTAGRAGA